MKKFLQPARTMGLMLLDSGVLRFGRFTRPSGNRAAYAFDLGHGLVNCHLRRCICAQYIEYLKRFQFDYLLGASVGGDPWAALLAQVLERPLLLWREQSEFALPVKDHNAQVLLIEDVVDMERTLVDRQRQVGQFCRVAGAVSFINLISSDPMLELSDDNVVLASCYSATELLYELSAAGRIILKGDEPQLLE